MDEWNKMQCYSLTRARVVLAHQSISGVRCRAFEAIKVHVFTNDLGNGKVHIPVLLIDNHVKKKNYGTTWNETKWNELNNSTWSSQFEWIQLNSTYLWLMKLLYWLWYRYLPRLLLACPIHHCNREAVVTFSSWTRFGHGHNQSHASDRKEVSPLFLRHLQTPSWTWTYWPEQLRMNL